MENIRKELEVGEEKGKMKLKSKRREKERKEIDNREEQGSFFYLIFSIFREIGEEIFVDILIFFSLSPNFLSI